MLKTVMEYSEEQDPTNMIFVEIWLKKLKQIVYDAQVPIHDSTHVSCLMYPVRALRVSDTL